MRGKGKYRIPPAIKDPCNKPPFDYDCFSQIPHVSPLAKTVGDFDWDSVFAAFGEKPDTAAVHHDQIAEQVGEVLRWLTRGCASGHVDLEIIGRRVVTLAWTISPEMFSNASLPKLAKMLGCSVQKIRECGVARLVGSQTAQRTCAFLPTFPDKKNE